MSDPTNGGKRINSLERSDAAQDAILGRVEGRVDKIYDMLEKALPQIVRNEERIRANRVWVGRLWTLGIALLLLGAKAAFF